MEEILPWNAQKKPTYQHLDFGILATRTVRQCISVVLIHQVMLCCYGGPSKLTEHLKQNFRYLQQKLT